MIEKLPFFFDFDRNKVTSLMFADFPIILLTSSPFQKYVPGIIEACVLAFFLLYTLLIHSFVLNLNVFCYQEAE